MKAINSASATVTAFTTTFLKFDDNAIIPTQPMFRKIQKYLRQIYNLFTTNKLSLLLEALSNCYNFTVITILYDKDVLTWDHKNNNKYQVKMSESIKQFQGKGVIFLFKIALLREINKDSFNCN